MGITRLTTLQKTQLNNSSKAMQNAQLATKIDDMAFGGIVAPSAGTVSQVSVVKYRTAPALGTNTYVHAATTLGAAEQTVSTAITNPDVPRILVIKGNASGIAGNVAFTGTDIDGNALTETIALSGSSAVAGTKAFKTVTSYVLPAKTNGSGDTVSVGVGDKIGFPVAIPNASLVIAKSFNLTVDAGTVTAAATLPASIYAPAGTLDGAKYVDLWFLV